MPILFALKRALRPLSILLLIICAAAIALAGKASETVHAPQAGVVDLSGSPEGAKIVSHLLENGFVRYSTPEEAEELVQRGALNCAVILPEDLSRSIRNCDMEGCIRWIVSPTSFAPDLPKAHVTAAVFRECAPYLAAIPFEGTDVTAEDVVREYELMFEAGYAFSFDVLTAEEGGAPTDLKKQSLAMGAASILLLAIMLSFCGEVTDTAFRDMSGRLGLRGALTKIMLPGILVRTILAAAAGCVGLALAELPQLTAPLVIYVFLLTGVGLMLSAVLSGVRQLYILLSVLVIASAALCPIVTDLALILPPLKIVRYFLPPYWLWLAADHPLPAAGAAITACIVGAILPPLRYALTQKYRFK